MKLFGFTILEKFKGYFSDAGSEASAPTKFNYGANSWLERCKWADRIYEVHPLAKSQTLTIAGQFLAGITDEVPLKPAGEYDRAEEATEKCRQLNRDISLPTLLFDTVIDIVKFGTSFWEKTDIPFYSARRIPQMQFLEPASADALGNITGWRYGMMHGSRQWSADEVAEFSWNVSSATWPYGTSLYTGLDTEFSILEQLESDMKEYMHKNAFPKELWQVGNGEYVPPQADVAKMERKLKTWTPGQHFVTNYPIDYRSGGTGDRRIENLPEVLNFLKDQAVDGLMIPPISKQYNATQASAKEMMPWAHANLIRPMQRIIGDVLEKQLYEPYLISLGYSAKTTPHVLWEPPDAHKEEQAQYYTLLVGGGIMPPRLAARELGFEEDFLEWEKEKKAEQEKLMSRQDEQRQAGKMEPLQQQGGKSWKVTELQEAEDEEGRWVTINGVHVLIKQGEDVATAFKRTTGKDLEPEKTDPYKGWAKDEYQKVVAKAQDEHKVPTDFLEKVRNEKDRRMIGRYELDIRNEMDDKQRAADKEMKSHYHPEIFDVDKKWDKPWSELEAIRKTKYAEASAEWKSKKEILRARDNELGGR